jgi:hypothetical protein
MFFESNYGSIIFAISGSPDRMRILTVWYAILSDHALNANGGLMRQYLFKILKNIDIHMSKKQTYGRQNPIEHLYLPYIATLTVPLTGNL